MRRRTTRSDNLPALLFLGPFMILLVVFRVIPIVGTVITSMQRFSLLEPNDRKFVGAGNYSQLLHDAQFRKSMEVTALFAVGMVVLEIPLALTFAMFLRGKGRGVRQMRMIVFAPVTMSVVVVAAVWRLLLDPQDGVFNGMLARVGLPGLDFLTSRSQALPSIILMVLWYQVGFSMILFIAGLQSIPGDLLEAAALDGAGARQRFRHVTLPLLSRTTMFVVLIITIFAFQQFAPAYEMTGGGPEYSTLFIVYYLYQQGFTFLNPGYASAIGVALVITILIISLTQRRILSRRQA